MTHGILWPLMAYIDLSWQSRTPTEGHDRCFLWVAGTTWRTDGPRSLQTTPHFVRHWDLCCQTNSLIMHAENSRVASKVVLKALKCGCAQRNILRFDDWWRLMFVFNSPNIKASMPGCGSFRLGKPSKLQRARPWRNDGSIPWGPSMIWYLAAKSGRMMGNSYDSILIIRY